MRIALVTESYFPNIDGGAVAQHELVLRLVKHGHQVIVFAPARGFKNYMEEEGGSKIYRCRALTFPLIPQYKMTLCPYFHMKKVLDEFKPDLFHIHNPYGLGLSGLVYAKKNKIKVVASNHLMPENFFMSVAWMSPVYHLLKNAGWKYIVWFHNRCDYVISPTGTAIQMLVDHGLKAAHGPVSNGVNLSAFYPGQDASALRQQNNIPSDKPVVLYTGRLSGEKSLPVLIRAIPLITKEIPCHFVFAGVGREKENLEQMVNKMNIHDRVTFVGGLSRTDLPKIYNLGSLFCIPSTAELQSIVTMEAMATGLPIVAAKAGALPELCQDGVNGYLAKPFDSQDHADKIIKILKDPGLARKMGEQSMAIIKKHSFDEVIKVFEGVYAKVLKGQAS